MFKKINKIYFTLFGDDDSCMNGTIPDNTTPLIYEVRSLKYKVKAQEEFIDSLLNHLNLTVEHEYSHFGDSKLVIKKK